MQISSLSVSPLEVSFFVYMQIAENAELWKGNESAMLHDSPEGGTKTLGFGYKLNVLEQQTQQVRGFGIAEYDIERARRLLNLSLVETKHSLAKEFPQHWYKLTQRQQEMLVCMQYNLGSVRAKFPKFTEAVLKDDIETQRREYKRYYMNEKGNWKETEERNRLFFERYLSDEALAHWGVDAA